MIPRDWNYEWLFFISPMQLLLFAEQILGCLGKRNYSNPKKLIYHTIPIVNYVHVKYSQRHN